VAPILDELARENQGRLKFVKLNADENQNTTNRYAIVGLPSMYIFKHGIVVAKMQGAGSKEEIEAAINKVCGPIDNSTSGSNNNSSPSAPQPGNNSTSPSSPSAGAQPTAMPTASVLTNSTDLPIVDEPGFDRDVLKSATPVFVFFCDGSEGCNRIWPTIQAVAEKAGDNYRFVRVNIAAHPALAQEYFVNQVPTFIIFKDGKRKKQITGLVQEKDLLSFLELPNRAASAEITKSTTF
jgi:thioredoxin 1